MSHVSPGRFPTRCYAQSVAASPASTTAHKTNAALSRRRSTSIGAATRTLTRASRRLQKDSNRRAACPHPRVTAVAKKQQPPRRLPSPATQRARDLQKGVEQVEPLHTPCPCPERGQARVA